MSRLAAESSHTTLAHCCDSSGRSCIIIASLYTDSPLRLECFSRSRPNRSSFLPQHSTLSSQTLRNQIQSWQPTSRCRRNNSQRRRHNITSTTHSKPPRSTLRPRRPTTPLLPLHEPVRLRISQRILDSCVRQSPPYMFLPYCDLQTRLGERPDSRPSPRHIARTTASTTWAMRGY